MRAEKKGEASFVRMGGKKIAITNAEKILFPKSKITKGDLISYYQKIARFMIPKIKDRPVSMLRYPNGIQQEGFFQKNVSEFFPSWIKVKAIERKGQEEIRMVLCNEGATLVYLANLACITPHVWLSRQDKIDYPDRMIFDLDPPGKGAFGLVQEGAKALRKVLEGELGLKAFVMTTGSKGLHLVVPLKRDADFDLVRGFAKKVADLLAKREPEKYTTEHRINKRKKRLFIDYLRNAYAQTGVAPYAVRALEGAPVAAPLAWSELTPELTAQTYHIKNMPERALKKKDPWAKLNASACSICQAEKRVDLLLEE